jgi:hypothetical protein
MVVGAGAITRVDAVVVSSTCDRNLDDETLRLSQAIGVV